MKVFTLTIKRIFVVNFLFFLEESPPKKIKLNPTVEEALNEKMDTTESCSATETDKPLEEIITPVKMLEESTLPESSCSIKEINDPVSCAVESSRTVEELDDTVENTLTNTITSSDAPSIINISSDSSTCLQHRAELLRDIESHIEICFECLDDEILDNILISDDNTSQTKATTVNPSHHLKEKSENKFEDGKKEPNKTLEEKNVMVSENRDAEKSECSIDSTITTAR